MTDVFDFCNWPRLDTIECLRGIKKSVVWLNYLIFQTTFKYEIFRWIILLSHSIDFVRTSLFINVRGKVTKNNHRNMQIQKYDLTHFSQIWLVFLFSFNQFLLLFRRFLSVFHVWMRLKNNGNNTLVIVRLRSAVLYFLPT